MIDYIATITGAFEGELDVDNGRVKCRITGDFQFEGKNWAENIKQFSTDPLLRSTETLSSLFHNSAVVCKADAAKILLFS